MAEFSEHTIFNVDEMENAVIGIATRVGKHDSGMHQHQKGQLLYAPKGCMSISLNGIKCVLPPTRAAWIPANTPHCARMTNVVEYRSLYFDPSLNASLPSSLKIVAVNPLLKALIERMAFWEWDKPQSGQKNTTALFFEELASAKEELLQLPLPSDRRLQSWVQQLNEPTYIAPPLNQLSQSVGASGKTISRIFNKETGMAYQAWRQQWRLLKSIELLSEGLQVNDVAYQLEFSSDSAFISFFKQQTGITPFQYM
ncbi:AraC family transcriptional regulator [Photobacterium proteolyticum]|uniref:AraC family transcriptional regulator n=1 Tax=Photobacterium proteolyticum TaxID=1903952 RepID=A0A1Q9GCS1_9GAMM|nr:helix-turn-helix transcriptional regulator [Photobacterium proteolyticum]OLQ72174.1 AraC family transcriptional regulator [Photobacterium proteolyticum]